MTCVPWAKLAVQVVGQLIPAGLLVTAPAFADDMATVSWNEGGCENVVFPLPQPARRSRKTKETPV